MIIAICTIIAIVTIIMTVIGHIKANENLVCSGIVLLIADIVLGFGLLCFAIPVGDSKITYLDPIEKAKTENTVFVKNPEGVTFESKIHSVYMAYDNLKIKRTVRFNSWGTECQTIDELCVGESLEKK